jgi:hypothetical protein
MSATGRNQQTVDSTNHEDHTNERTFRGATATLIELGIALARAESSSPVPGRCLRCVSYRNPKNSTAQCPNVFCSEKCEQEFVRAALGALTIEDCIRIHGRLEMLLTGSGKPHVE